MKTILVVTVHFLSLLFFSGDPESQVKTALNQQVVAWNKGDLEQAMSFYWNSPDLLWINRAGVQKGYQQVWEDYKKIYTDKSKMGKFSFEPLHIETINSELVYYVFKWKIESDGKTQMGGVSSQVWKKINNNWKIISEHAS